MMVFASFTSGNLRGNCPPFDSDQAALGGECPFDYAGMTALSKWMAREVSPVHGGD